MRSGTYAVVDGVEYSAMTWDGKVSLFIPRVGEKPEGWDLGADDTWYSEIDASEVSDAYSVRTRASLDDVKVYVDSVNATNRTAIVRAVRPTSINDRSAPPPHPLLQPIDDPPYSVDWVATVPWDRLTEVSEAVGRIDPSTGSRIYDEAP